MTINKNTINPIEHKFFRYIIKQLDYTSVKHDTMFTILPMENLLEHFSNKYNVSHKQLLYYLKKWNKNKFFEYDKDLSKKGYFYNLDNLISYGYIHYYSEIVPTRVFLKYKAATFKIQFKN